MKHSSDFKITLLQALVLALAARFGAGELRAQQPITAAAPAQPAPSKPEAPSKDAIPTYLRDVQPIFMGKCVRCHNADERMLPNWLNYKAAFADRVEIKRRVWDSWKGDYYKQPMPAGAGPECQAITEAERERIKDWVEDGAPLGTPPTHLHFHSQPELMAQGMHLFNTVCALCHQPDAKGLPGKFPPLADSDFLNADKDRAIKILLHGRQGDITVNGKTYNNSMPMFPLNDDDIAAALSYVYSSFGNSGKTVTPAEVKALRAQKDDQLPAPATEVAHTPPPKSEFE